MNNQSSLDSLRESVRILLVRSKLSQHRLAEILEVHPATLSHALTGTREGSCHVRLLHRAHDHMTGLLGDDPGCASRP
jgi:predicted transcriptional regulator